MQLNRVSFSGFRLRDRVSFCKNWLPDRVHICHVYSKKVVLGPLHSANVIQITWIAIFQHFSIDFAQISLQGTILSEETKGQGIV